MSKLFQGILLIIVAVGCAQNSDSDKNNEYPFPMYNTSSPLYKELKSASITCEDSRCDSNKSDFESIGVVGMLAKGKPTDYEFGMGQCTGFLYGSQEIVALNSHCITDSMWENRDNCEEYLGIKFPAVPGHEEEIRMCDKILYRSDLSTETAFNIKADYAFFKIKKVNRQALNLAKTPVRNQDAISFRKVNPLSGVQALGGRLDYSFCLAQTESLLNSNYSNEWSDTGLGISYGGKDYTKKCEIRKGNSGSPVLNTKNEIVGFAQSYATENFLNTLKSEKFAEEAKKQYQIDFVLDLPYKLPDHFQFTQSLCARDPNKLNVENSLCSDKRNLNPKSKEEILADFSNAKNIDEYLKQITVEIYKVFPKFFQLDLQKKKDYYSYNIKPKCVLNENQWDKGNLLIDDSSIFKKAKTINIYSKPIFIDLKVTYYIDNNMVYKNKTISHTVTYGDFITEIISNTLKVYRTYLVGKYYSYKEKEQFNDVDWCR